MAQNFRMTGRLPNESMIAMDETTISRGFRSKRQEQTPKNRLPPGQYVTTDFPVLSAGPTPQIKLGDWTFALQLGGSLLGNELGRVRGAPSDDDQEGYSLRYQMVETRYDLARRDIRRFIEGGRPQGATRFLHHGSLRRGLHNKRPRRGSHWG